ncbi:MAG: SDR family NAD(P)-dependent oxidoreductase [Anaerolineae bacterium]|nr:SDR family NAD(P)-dependent oxidoreductase [Anaerolineae bacterium]
MAVHVAGEKVLVTGAGGFIGSHLVEFLVQQGHAVRAMTRYTSGDRRGNLAQLPSDVMKQVEMYPADVRDADAVRQALGGVDAVFHLAAIISIPYSYRHPEETVAVNVTGTLNVLQAMRALGTRRGVIVSTSEVYGSAQYVPIDEKHPLQPQSPYSASKIGAESLSVSFQRSFGLPVVVVRPFNTYGPRQSARAVIPTIIAQALTRNVIELGAVHTYRDYTYASDTARGLYLAAYGPGSEAALGQIVNLGTGESNTIASIAQRIIARVGRPLKIAANRADRMRPDASEVLRLQSDNRLANELFGWTPEVSLDEGLDRTIAWVRDHLSLFEPESYTV